MKELIFTILMFLPIVFIIGSIVFRRQQYKWARTKADKIILCSMEADVSYINGIIEILRPARWYTTRHEDDVFRVEQLRIIRDKQMSQS